MKKNLTTWMLLGFLFAFQAMNAQVNLIKGSGNIAGGIPELKPGMSGISAGSH